MSTNPKTKSYSRRVSRLARKLAFGLSHTAESAADIITRVDPKATRAMHRKAVQLAVEECNNMECMYQKLTAQHREGRAALQEFQKHTSFRVINGGRA